MMDGGMGGCKLQRVTLDADLVGSSWMRETSLHLLATHPYLFRPYHLITRYFTTQTENDRLLYV